MTESDGTSQLSGSTDRDVLVIFTMDVEPPTRADGYTSGPSTTAEGARRVREYAGILREHGYAPTYFVHPELGEQQADLLLLDEPLNNLDVPTQELIFHTLVDLAAGGRAVIVSTHDLGILPIHFNRAIFLDKHVIADGPVDDVLTAETLARAYGVRLCTDEDEEHPHAQLAG